jgi:hypothetical protein
LSPLAAAGNPPAALISSTASIALCSRATFTMACAPLVANSEPSSTARSSSAGPVTRLHSAERSATQRWSTWEQKSCARPLLCRPLQSACVLHPPVLLL